MTAMTFSTPIPARPFSAGWRLRYSRMESRPSAGSGGWTAGAKNALRHTAWPSRQPCWAIGLVPGRFASPREQPVPSRILRLSVGFVRSKQRLGLAPGSAMLRTVLATARAIADASVLPGPVDFETDFAPGRAHVRRVPRQNLWVLYRFDATHVDVLTVRTDPPVPAEPNQ